MKQLMYDYIDRNAETYTTISHKVWDYAELSLQEYKSAALYIAELKKAGFAVTENLANIETAFLGSFTEGPAPGTPGAGPVIGILAEFDALSGMSQKAGSIVHELPDAELAAAQKGCGHGCGHNELGAGSFGAACAVKQFLEETKTPGTVVFYGCPGEEGGASKAFLAREGEWKKLDAALCWHPGTRNEVTTGTCHSCCQVLYKFKGLTANPAIRPEAGRSALDAVELMNVGCNYLREHMKNDCKIHYAIVDGGGVSPNVIQPTASVVYMARSVKVRDSIDLLARIDKIAQGAALMTETTYDRVFVDGTANLLPNTAIEKVLHANLNEAPMPVYTDEEWAYAQALTDTVPALDEVPGLGPENDKTIREEVRKLSNNCTKPLFDFVYPFYTGEEFKPGSTDVGDVSWLTPTSQVTTVCYPTGCPSHSWEVVSSGRTSIADKGMLYAAKVLAGAAADLFTKPEALAEAKAEFAERTKYEQYVCPIEEDAVPVIVG